jgi:hypothetical protein
LKGKLKASKDRVKTLNTIRSTFTSR